MANIDITSLDLEEPNAASSDVEQAMFRITDSLGPVSFVDEDSFSLDDDLELGGDESEDISEATLLKSGVDFVKTLTPYANLLAEASRSLFVKRSEKDDATKFSMSYSSFKFMPEDVYRVFHTILVDLASEEEHRNDSVDSALEKSLDYLFDSTGWSPQLAKQDYEKGFKSYYESFKRIANAPEAVDKTSLESLVDAGEVALSHRVFHLNTTVFNEINLFLADNTNTRENNKLGEEFFGSFFNTYKSVNKIKHLTVGQAKEAILSYLSSSDLMAMLELSQDEVLDYTAGELIRRYLQFELQTGMLYPVGLREYQKLDASAIANSLKAAVMSGSVVAEILLNLVEVMFKGLDEKTSMETVVRYLEGVGEYLLAYLENSALICPVMYASATKKGTDGLYLTYAVGESSYTTESRDILCELVGGKSTIYCVPRVHIDNKHGYAVCPPNIVVSNLRSVQTGGHVKIQGDVGYSYKPTLSWLADLNILTDENNDSSGTISYNSFKVNNPLLSTFMNYDNKFDTSVSLPKMSLITLNGIGEVFILVENGDVHNILKLVLSDGQIFYNGKCIMNTEDGSLLITYIDSDTQAQHTITLENGEYEEVDIEQSEENIITKLEVLDFLNPDEYEYVAESEQNSFSSVVRRVCELASMDYNERVKDARKLISRSFTHILALPLIDISIGRRLIESYRDLCAGQGELDEFNSNSLREIVGFVKGYPNEFESEGLLTKEQLLRIFKDNDESASGLKTLIDWIGGCDIDLLALQTLCKGEASEHNLEELYCVVSNIPSVRCKLRRLEDDIVLLNALSILGSAVILLLKKKTELETIYNKTLSKEGLPSIEKELKSIMKYKGGNTLLRTTKQVLESEVAGEALITKYFLMERDLYGVLTSLEETGSIATDLYKPVKKDLGLGRIKRVAGITHSEYRKLVTKQHEAAVYAKHREAFRDSVYAGILTEVSTSVPINVIKAYDLIRTFGTELFRLMSDNTDDSEDILTFEREFIKYAGSLVVSYCPVVGEAIGGIDGGVDRASQFLLTPDDYLYSVPLEGLRSVDLTDIRTLV